MKGSWRVGRIAGIDIDVHPSWLLIYVLLTFSLATTWFPELARGVASWVYWVAGAVAGLLLFVAVLAHELAHALVARARGLPVSSITLFIFGGVSNIEREPGSAGAEFQMAFVGPLTSLLLGALALLLTAAVGRSAPLLSAILYYLGVANLLLGVFNLIPAFPLDGGRVLRAIVWRLSGSLETATRLAVRAGQVFSALFVLLGLWVMFRGDPVDGIWSIFVGVFLLQAGYGESARLTHGKLGHTDG